jgi:tRNA pseudouridine55 synthase
MDGVLVIDKPAGPTSHDVVARIRRSTRVERVGHTGTLDPMATGVLPLVLGRATRLARFLSSADKEYEATVRLGQDTDTDDATGRLIEEAAGATGGAGASGAVSIAAVNETDLRVALGALLGTYPQTPPAFSAKKIGGIRAYALARRGEAVEPRPVDVTAHRLELGAFDGTSVRLLVVCSAGFYVRSLARDLGRRLGTGAHLAALRRVRSGQFGCDRAVPLDVAEQEGLDALGRLIPMNEALHHLPAVVLTEQGVGRAAHGNEIGVADLAGPFVAATPDRAVRLVSPAGALVAVAEAGSQPGLLHPVVVVV